MSTPSADALVDHFLGSDFAARLAAAKCECFAAEHRGEDVPLARIAELLGVPADLAEVLLAWNVANANAGAIIDAMAADRRDAAEAVKH